MTKTELNFVSCLNENYGFGSPANMTSATYCIAYIPNPSVRIPQTYANDPNLAGKVSYVENTGGWQKYVLDKSCTIEFTVRGGAGGCSIWGDTTINPNTGIPQGANAANAGYSLAPGRGAKLVGKGKFKKGDIFYLLVGARGDTNQSCQGNGGGASVVLLDNPNGEYTFQPLNRKVDVLFVAGGGGGTSYKFPHPNRNGDSISQNRTWIGGRDAVLANGTDTLGGKCYKQDCTSIGTSGEVGQSGAGLTGNGYTYNSTAGVSQYALLKGMPNCTMNTNGVWDKKYGTWGGGAPGGYNSAGGGGGYSGGSGYYRAGADGGTSFINSKYIEEISRGYATISEDSGRRCSNPWSAYGHISMTMEGRNPDKKILAYDSEGYKYFDGVPENPEENHVYTNTWKLLQNQDLPEENTYLKYGFNGDIISSEGLLDNVKFLVMSPESEESINILGNVKNTIVIQKDCISTSDIKEFKEMVVTSSLNNVDIRFAVSKNQGATWQTYNTGQWIDIDINDIDEFSRVGYGLNNIDSIPIADWNTYKPATINFALCITQNGDIVNPIISKIATKCDLVGSWRHYKESEASYQYTTDSELEVTFLQAGNYKVNYLDSLNTTSN